MCCSAQQPVNMEKEKLEKAAYILKAIAHPARLKIIEVLDRHPELTVTELCAQTDCEQSVMSHHLTNMKLKGLITSRRMGTNMYYALKEKEVTKILTCIENCNCNFV